MTTYTSVFGADTVPPSDYSYTRYDVTASITLVWSEQYGGANVLAADILELNVTVGSLTVTLPPANAASVGRDMLLRNVGNQTVSVVNAAAGAVTTIAPGEAKYVYITGNATAAGTWAAFTFGTGTSSADAAALAGLGLQASNGTIRVYLAYLAKSANYSIDVADRAKLINVTSGVVTLTLPQASVAGNGFWLALRNSGTGSVTVDPFGTEMVNGSLTFTLNQNESTLIATDGSSWYTVGQGKDATFTFSEFVVNAAAGNVTLSAADVAGRMIRIAGTAVGNIVVTLPSIDNIYFVNTEAGLGGFSATFTTGAGATLALGANLRTAIYSDGTNIRTAVSTTVTSAISLDDGSPAAPSLTFALDSNLGLFRLAADQMGFTANGAQVGFWDVNGWNGPAILTGTPTAPTAAAGTNTTQIATTAHVFAERSNVLTLTNKTFNLASNTLTGTKAQFDIALSDDNFGYLATANTWTAKQTISGDLEFSGNARRILGDFSNATTTNRTAFQTSTVNANTTVGCIPNGTGNTGSFIAYSSSDILNSNFAHILAIGSTEVRVNAGLAGSATAVPLTFYTNNAERLRVTTSGDIGVGTTTPNYSAQSRAVTVEGSTSAAFEISSTRADGSGLTLGTFEWNYATNSVGHKRVAVVSGVSSGSTVNQRGGDIAVSLKPNGSTVLNEIFRLRGDSFSPASAGSFTQAQIAGAFGGGLCFLDTNHAGVYVDTLAANMYFFTGQSGADTATSKIRLSLLPTRNETTNFTKLGESSPAIKVKKLTGTTAASQGADSAVAHGVTASKIIGLQAIATDSGGVLYPQGHTDVAGKQYSLRADSTSVILSTHATNSSNIISRPFSVLVTYEE